MNKNIDNLSKEIEDIKKNQWNFGAEEYHNQILKNNNSMGDLKRKMEQIEESISELDERAIEIIQSGQQRENSPKRKKNLWD